MGLLAPGLPAFAQAVATADARDGVAYGVQLRQRGLLDSAVTELDAVRTGAASPAQRTRATGELGITLLQAHRPETAAPFLQQAYEQSSGADKARYAVYLGNLAMARRQSAQARAMYQAALDLAPALGDIQISVGLNLARLSPQAQQLPMLRNLGQKLDSLPPGPDRAAQNLNLGNLSRQLGPAGVQLAYHHLARAQDLARQAGNLRLQVQADDVLAQLYEDRGRRDDAMELTRQGIARAAQTEASESADLRVNLEWRSARLHQAGGRTSEALAAYRRTLALVESIKQDIPIYFDDGRSSFAALLEPVYSGYADLVLRQLDGQPVAAQQDQLRSVVQTIELMRQGEIQDFLGDRCAVETVQGGASGALPAGTAVLYPVVLPDRVELLLVTAGGVQRKTTRVPAATLQATAERLSRWLRDGVLGVPPQAQSLYDWLLRPFDGALADAGFKTLVVAPAGVLRLVPMSVLHDGEHYVIERFAIAEVTGMTMTNMAPRPGRGVEALVAGVSYPGAAVEKLDRAMVAAVSDNEAPAAQETRSVFAGRQIRSIRSIREVQQAAGKEGDARAVDELRERFALPGVKEEVEALRAILPGANILNQDFTVRHFTEEAESGRYRIVHIATHGFFGGSAEASFIMAYDDLLTLNGLQSLLQSENFEKNPIELLSLSACQTAEGNDRAPLGISGAAIKARAKSVIGTLWSVDDSAAKALMKNLYTAIATEGLGKAEALRRAQLELLHDKASSAPFFWAPFVLVGNWL